MNWVYLVTDIRGAASRITYGEQGDRVHILKNDGKLVMVCSESGEKYFVYPHELSSTPIEKKIQDNEKQGIKGKGRRGNKKSM